MGEQYCKLYSEVYDLETVCLRYANVFGKRQRNEGSYCNVMGIFNQQKEKDEPMTIVGDGTQRRDFIHVDDVVDANIRVGLYQHPIWGDVFNVGSGKNYSVNDIAKMMGGKTTNIPPRIEPKESLLDSINIRNKFNWKPKIDLKDWLGEINV